MHVLCLNFFKHTKVLRRIANSLFFVSGLKEPYAHAMQRVKIYMYHQVFLGSKSFTPIRSDLCMCNEESIFFYENVEVGFHLLLRLKTQHFVFLGIFFTYFIF